MDSPRDNVPALHGVRGLAALTVFASHAANVCFAGAYLGNGGGQLGVMLFFMLSGYLMSLLYMAKPLDSGQARSFIVNRMARIYPMFALVVVANFAVVHLFTGIGTYGVVTGSDLVEHLLFVKGYSAFWTIGPEVLFYGLFLVLWRAKIASNAVFAALLVALLLVSTIPGAPSRDNSIVALHHRLPFFLVGSVLGLFHQRWVAAKSPLLDVAFYCALALFVFGFPKLTAMAVDLPADMQGDASSVMWVYPFYLAVCAALLITAIASRPWVLTNRAAIFMGNISFSFYLLHVLVLINIYNLFRDHPLRVIAASLLLTAALSWLCHVAVESPCRRWIRARFGKPRNAIALAERTADAA